MQRSGKNDNLGVLQFQFFITLDKGLKKNTMTRWGNSNKMLTRKIKNTSQYHLCYLNNPHMKKIPWTQVKLGVCLCIFLIQPIYVNATLRITTRRVKEHLIHTHLIHWFSNLMHIIHCTYLTPICSAAKLKNI